MKLPNKLVRKAAVRKVKVSGDAKPSKKRPRTPSPARSASHSTSSAPLIRRLRRPQGLPRSGLEQGAPVDLTADTPPEGNQAEAPPMTERPTSPKATQPQADHTPPPVKASPEPPFRRDHAPSDLPAEGEGSTGGAPQAPLEEGGEHGVAPPRPPSPSSGFRTEPLVAQIGHPEYQRELLRRGAASLLQDAFSAQVWTANSLIALRDILRETEEALRRSRQETSEVRDRSERAEVALAQRSEELVQIEHRTKTEFELLRGRLEVAGAAAKAQDAQIQSLSLESEAAAKRALVAEEEAHRLIVQAAELEVRALGAEDRAKAAEDRAASAAERAVLAEEKAVVSADRAVAEFRVSTAFSEELAEASAGAYLLGFEDGKKKVGRLHGLTNLDHLEPDEASDDSSTSARPAVDGPPEDGAAGA